MENENKMGTMPINKLLISMSIPMVVSMLVQALYNIVDSIFVAQLSENALTAVSLAFPAQNFMLAFAIGTCVALGGNILSDAFGIVAMVAMTPLITIQLLGFTSLSRKRYAEKLAMKKILEENDDQIIRFL